MPTRPARAAFWAAAKSSRLYKTLVYDKQIAQDVIGAEQQSALGSVLELQVTAKPGVKPEDLEKAIDEQLERMRIDGPAQAELDRARNLIETHMITAWKGWAALAAWLTG